MAGQVPAYQQITLDREIGASDIQSLGFGYLERQVKNMEIAASMIVIQTPGVIPDDRREDALIYWQILRDLITRTSDIMQRHHLHRHGPFQIVACSRIFLEETIHLPAKPPGYQVATIHLVPMTNIVLELYRLAKEMEADQLVWFRPIGHSIKLIGSNIQHCLHQFDSHQFVPGLDPPTQDYPLGPQTALVRVAMDLQTDIKQLAYVLSSVPYPASIKSHLNSMYHGSVDIFERAAMDDLAGIRVTKKVVRSHWNLWLEYMLNNNVRPLATYQQAIRTVAASVAGGFEKLEQLVPR